MSHPHYTFDNSTLYTDLLNLCDGSDVFYFQDHVYHGDTYRIFNYRLASYGDFQNRHALECRGHTFRLIDGGAILVSLPMEKFFNLGENPFTMDIDFTEVSHVEEKRDGSLISTVNVGNHDDVVHVKSKGSFTSDQAKAAFEMLNYGDLYWEFAKLLRTAVASNYTVNMEYTSPTNQIVVGYKDSSLKVLNIRNNETGEYIDPIQFGFRDFEVVERFEAVVDDEWISEARKSVGDEGYIVYLKNGLKFKLKNDWYCNLHLQKEQVNQPRRLFEAVLNETSDDLKTLFINDAVTVERINEMEVMVKREFNHLAHMVDSFYTENRELSRKDYAILGQQVLAPHGVFSQAMNLYLGQASGLHEWMIKNYKRFINETEQETE